MNVNPNASRASEDWLPINALSLAPLQPLPVDLWTPDGRLLLAKGHSLDTHEQIRLLVGHHPVVRVRDAHDWRLATGDRAGTPLKSMAAQPRAGLSSSAMAPGLYERWLDLHGALHLLLRRASDDFSAEPLTDFPERIASLGEQLAQLVRKQPDESLFILVQLLYDGQSPYCASNALAAAALTDLLGPLAGLPAAQQTALRQAALTMNLGMARLQDELALQKAPPAEHQRARIAEHPSAGRRMLETMGVTDASWLDLVLHHHETPDGKGYPAGLRVDNLPLQMLRLADRFVARISPRKSRASLSARQAVRAHYLEMRHSSSPLAELLVRRIGLYLPGSYVRLRNDEVAVVVRITDAVDKPSVLAILNKSGMPYGTPRLRDTSMPEFQIVEPVLAEKVKLRLDPARVFAA